MTKTCVVIGCKSGCKTLENIGKTFHWFPLPYRNEAKMVKWKQTGCLKPELEIKPFHSICHLHFTDQMVTNKGAQIALQDGSMYTVNTKWKLAEDAYPCIFNLETVKMMNRLRNISDNDLDASSNDKNKKSVACKIPQSCDTVQKRIKHLKTKIEICRTAFEKLKEDLKNLSNPIYYKAMRILKEPQEMVSNRQIDEKLEDITDIAILSKMLADLMEDLVRWRKKNKYLREKVKKINDDMAKKGVNQDINGQISSSNLGSNIDANNTTTTTDEANNQNDTNDETVIHKNPAEPKRIRPNQEFPNALELMRKVISTKKLTHSWKVRAYKLKQKLNLCNGVCNWEDGDEAFDPDTSCEPGCLRMDENTVTKVENIGLGGSSFINVDVLALRKMLNEEYRLTYKWKKRCVRLSKIEKGELPVPKWVLKDFAPVMPLKQGPTLDLGGGKLPNVPMDAEDNTCAFLVDVTSNDTCVYDVTTSITHKEPLMGPTPNDIIMGVDVPVVDPMAQGSEIVEHNYAVRTSSDDGLVGTLSHVSTTATCNNACGTMPKVVGHDLVSNDPLSNLNPAAVGECCTRKCGVCCSKVKQLEKFKQQACRLRQQYNNWRQKYYRLKKSVNKKKDKPLPRPGFFITYKNEEERKFLAALVERKRQRYSTNHLVDCVRLLSKGRSVYNFMRDSTFRTMPSIQTIMKMKNKLSKVNHSTFGLSKYNLQLLKTKMEKLPENQRFVSLKFGEVFLKAGLPNTEGPSENLATEQQVSKRMQINAMVFTLESLSSELNYVISNYKSNGGLKGTEVKEKLEEVIKAVEECGAAVLTVSSNCSNPVKTAYKLHGIGVADGYLCNSVPNFVNGDRRIFFFHDMTHILKNIRKHILKPKNKGLLFMGQAIDFKYIHRAFELDLENANGRVCPDLTKEHFNISEVKKSTVYALQMFSGSVALSVGHYRESGDPFMENSESTELFVKWLSDLYDTLSTNDVSNGVVENGTLLQNLENAYQILNSAYEMNFASKVTMECLKLTVHSALELCLYLLRECNFEYVLTSKLMNQDKMETIVQM